MGGDMGHNCSYTTNNTEETFVTQLILTNETISNQIVGGMCRALDSFAWLQKRIKKEKVRPILVNKDNTVENCVLDKVVEVPPANHFEELHPKDEFELLCLQTVSACSHGERYLIHKCIPHRFVLFYTFLLLHLL